MDTEILLIYCLADEFLKAVEHHEDQQRTMSDAEVITTALVAMRYFGGNFEKARKLLKDPPYIPTMLSPSQFNRRLHRLTGLLVAFFRLLAQAWKENNPDQVYLIDSFPIPVCDNIRINRSKIYPKEATEDAFRGHTASKRRYFYGLKVHLMTTDGGAPVEVFLTCGSFGDVRALGCFDFDLPEGATVYGDKAFNDYLTEDLLSAAASITLLPLRKKNSKRSVPAYVSYVQHHCRKMIETAGSLIERMLPKSIHAVTAAGFELKVFLFVLAYSLGFCV